MNVKTTHPVSMTAAATQTITSGGTSQVVFAGNNARKSLLIANPSASTLYVTIDGSMPANGVGIPMPTNGIPLKFDAGAIPINPVQIWGPTTGLQFYAVQA